MTNTEIAYMYRDAWNYKQTGYLVVEGYDPALIARIEATLDEGCYFLTEEVGMSSLRDNGWSSHYEDADHVWHEWCGAEPTDQKPDEPTTLVELTTAFELAKGWPMDRALHALEVFLHETPEGK